VLLPLLSLESDDNYDNDDYDDNYDDNYDYDDSDDYDNGDNDGDDNDVLNSVSSPLLDFKLKALVLLPLLSLESIYVDIYI
jgi:hypothetical protein